MNPKVSGALIFVIVLAMFVTGAIVYPYVGSFQLVFGLPMTLLILWGIWALLPAIDPVAKGFPGFRHIYDLVWILISAMLAYVYALVLATTLGWQVDVLRAVTPAVAVIFFVSGVLLPRIRRNWFFGVRTPWTLSSDEDWTKTHRFSSPIFMIAGVLILLGSFMPSPAWAAWFLVAPIILAAGTSVIYSYVVFRRRTRS